MIKRVKILSDWTIGGHNVIHTIREEETDFLNEFKIKYELIKDELKDKVLTTTLKIETNRLPAINKDININE